MCRRMNNVESQPNACKQQCDAGAPEWISEYQIRRYEERLVANTKDNDDFDAPEGKKHKVNQKATKQESAEGGKVTRRGRSKVLFGDLGRVSCVGTSKVTRLRIQNEVSL